MTNKLNLFYIFIVSIPTIWTFINLSNHGLNGYIRFVILIVFAAFNIYINSLYKHITAKVLTIAAPFFLIFITPAFNGFVHSGMFIWFPYGLIVIGSFSFFIFSLDDKREKFIIITMLVFFATAAILCDKILINFIDKSIDISFIEQNRLYYTTSQVIMVILLYSSFYSFKLIYHKQQSELTKLNSTLDDKIIELGYMSRNLEKLVKERTEKLNLQNDRIKDLAYTNAHGIRAYVVRIVGLSKLLELNISAEEEEFCKREIHANAQNLDNLTRRLSQQLVEEN